MVKHRIVICFNSRKKRAVQGGMNINMETMNIISKDSVIVSMSDPVVVTQAPVKIAQGENAFAHNWSGYRCPTFVSLPSGGTGFIRRQYAVAVVYYAGRRQSMGNFRLG